MNRHWRRYFGWSKSRAGLFRECRKRYSFQYLFKWEPGQTAAMAKALSKVNTLPIEKGVLLHREIETFLKTRRAGKPEDPEASLQRLERAFDILVAQAPRRLLEWRFGFQGGAEGEERLREAKADALEQLRAFYQDHWPRYRDLEVLAFEELERFEVAGNPLWVSADLVVQEGDTVLLVDWKTGRRESPAAESEQLTGYLLWAKRRFRQPLEALAAELVWFPSGTVDRTTRRPEDLDAYLEQVAADCEAMLAIDSYDAIEASPAEKACTRCPFLPLCREGSGAFFDKPSRQRVLTELREELGGKR